MRKNVCFWCIFGRWIQICFWNFLHQDTKVCFYRGHHKEFKEFFSQEVVSCFAMIFVPLWKFLAMNITQISGACSLIRQKWAWRWFYSTTETDSPLFLWLMQPTWREVMKEWCFCRVGLSMMNLIGSYVVISRLGGSVTRNATRVHKILLFPVWVGQPGQEESLCK